MDWNIGNSVFKDLNDKQGLMLCGYEWGLSKEDQLNIETGIELFYDPSALTIFSNKLPRHGKRALIWKYDNRIIKWFTIWGHPLSRDKLGTDFEKSIIQTNWCNTQANKIEENFYHKLTNIPQLENFIFHIKTFEPSLIFFMGSEMIDILQETKVLNEFSKIMGNAKSKPKKIQKEFDGRRFKIGFQEFDKCQIISLPHPSSSRGLSDDYMVLFSDEIGSLIAKFKKEKGIG